MIANIKKQTEQRLKQKQDVCLKTIQIACLMIKPY